MNATYNRGLFRMGSFNWDTDVIDLGVLLVKNTYVFSRLHNVVSDLTIAANEASGVGYARKIVTAAFRTTTEDDGNNWASFKITDSTVVWTAIDAGVDLRIVMFFIDGAGTGDDANNNLLCYIDTGTFIPIATNGGDATLNFDVTGALRAS